MVTNMFDMSASEVVLIIGNMAALIWGAAILKGSVDHLTKVTEKFEIAFEKITDRLMNHGERLGKVEGRLGMHTPVDTQSPQ